MFSNEASGYYVLLTLFLNEVSIEDWTLIFLPEYFSSAVSVGTLYTWSTSLTLSSVLGLVSFFPSAFKTVLSLSDF